MSEPSIFTPRAVPVPLVDAVSPADGSGKAAVATRPLSTRVELPDSVQMHAALRAIAGLAADALVGKDLSGPLSREHEAIKSILLLARPYRT